MNLESRDIPRTSRTIVRIGRRSRVNQSRPGTFLFGCRIKAISMSDVLPAVAECLLSEAPPGALSPAITAGLRSRPSLGLLQDAVTALLDAGRLDSAEHVLQGLLDYPAIPPWAAAGLARIAALKGDTEAEENAWRECQRRYPAHTPSAVALAALSTRGGRPEEAATRWRN